MANHILRTKLHFGCYMVHACYIGDGRDMRYIFQFSTIPYENNTVKNVYVLFCSSKGFPFPKSLVYAYMSQGTAYPYKKACEHGEDSNQPAHLHKQNLCRLSKESLNVWLPIERKAMTQNSLYKHAV